MDQKNDNKLDLVPIKAEVAAILADEEVKRSLLATTFKGLDEINVKKALFQGMMMGFTLRDFITKNVYATPFGNTYSLVTSIDYARKRGMRNGVVGVSAPIFTYKSDGSVDSCTITVKRKVLGEIGEYSATVFMDEYIGTSPLWKTKPKTMLAKVAEMHALRKACPEDASQMYIEEEFEKEEDNSFKVRIARAKGAGGMRGNGVIDLKNNEDQNNQTEEDDIIEVANDSDNQTEQTA